jgi:hypothetical protein
VFRVLRSGIFMPRDASKMAAPVYEANPMAFIVEQRARLPTTEPDPRSQPKACTSAWAWCSLKK